MITAFIEFKSSGPLSLVLKVDSSKDSTFSINLPFYFSVFETKAFLLDIDFSIFPLSLVLFFETSHKWAIPSSRVMAKT